MASAMPYEPEVNPFANEPSSNPASITDSTNTSPGFNDYDQSSKFNQNDETVTGTPSITSTNNEENQPQNQAEEEGLQGQQQQQQSPSLETQPQPKLKKYKLITKVTALERHGKKDPIIRFDAYTTLPRFRTTTFRDIRRTHHEFVKFFEHLNGNNPECIVPSVPPATTSAGLGTEEDEAKVKQNIQLWLDRVTSNPILARDEEFVYFIEADFGYSPVVKVRPPATGLARKAMKQLSPPFDEVTELQEFRPLVKQVYLSGTDVHSKLEKVTKHRRQLGLAMTEFGNKTSFLSNLESHNGMINMWRKLSKILKALGDLEAVKATSEAASLGDGMNWVAQDAYVAKEAMTNRHLLMRELVKAQATTKTRHNTAARVKGSTNLSPTKVDEAIFALEDAARTEEELTNKVRRVSDNMLLEKKVLLDHFEQDIKASIGEYVLRMIESDRRALSTWESVRLDVRAVDANGGLSRLGREATPASRRATIAQSQGLSGDSWSGDRHNRATDIVGRRTSFTSRRHSEENAEEAGEREEVDKIGEEEETIVDARNAASLLAQSTF